MAPGEGSKPELRLDGLLASKVLTGFKQSDKKRGGRRCTRRRQSSTTVTAVAFSTVFERATVSGSLRDDGRSSRVTRDGQKDPVCASEVRTKHS